MALTAQTLQATNPADVAAFYKIYAQEWADSYASEIDQQALFNEYVNSQTTIYLLKLGGEVIGGCEVALPNENNNFRVPCQDYVEGLEPFLSESILKKHAYCEITKVVIARARRSSNYLKHLLSQVVVDVHDLGVEALLSYSTYQHSVLYQRVYRAGIIENIQYEVYRNLFNIDIKGVNKEFCLAVYSRG